MVEALSRPARLAGYGYVETPIFEDTALFVRGVGESTDVVAKEMYTFDDKGGRSLTLRPEGTAPVLRAVLEHDLHTGSVAREAVVLRHLPALRAPQAGRYRHFWQVGAEAIGYRGRRPRRRADRAGRGRLRGARLAAGPAPPELLGDRTCGPRTRALCRSSSRGLDLDDDTRRRVEINPLRVLDDKRPEVRRQLDGAPLIVDSLCAECKAHHDAVRELLTDVGVSWEDDPRLVRGLDYYTRTTFEFVHDGLGSQSAVGGGGRYDGLSEDIGGPPLPGVGWALGVDRTMLASMPRAGIPPTTRAPRRLRGADR